MVRCGEDTLLRRPLSVHQADGRKMALLFTLVGKGTRWLSQRKAKDTVDIFGPLGNGFSIAPGSNNLLLVAGGIGIAPLYFAARRAREQGCSITLLYGTANKNRYTLNLPPEIKIVETTEDGTVGHQGLVTDLLPDFTGWADQIFACGPMPMYRDMAHRKAELGLEGKPVQIPLEVRMGCGLGVCYGCTVKTKDGLKQVCKDGPVFNLDNILWEELRGV